MCGSRGGAGEPVQVRFMRVARAHLGLGQVLRDVRADVWLMYVMQGEAFRLQQCFLLLLEFWGSGGVYSVFLPVLPDS